MNKQLRHKFATASAQGMTVYLLIWLQNYSKYPKYLVHNEINR